jgi:hypothetical protein
MRLNQGWDAEPNAPHPEVRFDHASLVLTFFLNPSTMPEVREDDRGELRFQNCRRYRLGPTNDDGWYKGECRFSDNAPEWGNFYEVTGDLRLDNVTLDWVENAAELPNARRHFLFYLRDETFECDADTWPFACYDCHDPMREFRQAPFAWSETNFADPGRPGGEALLFPQPRFNRETGGYRLGGQVWDADVGPAQDYRSRKISFLAFIASPNHTTAIKMGPTM